jgi:hypothetical protein
LPLKEARLAHQALNNASEAIDDVASEADTIAVRQQII